MNNVKFLVAFLVSILLGLVYIKLFIYNEKLAAEKTKQKSEEYTIENVVKSTVALVRPSTDRDGFFIYCSGVFVEPNIIATARHCVVDRIFYLIKKDVFDNNPPPEFYDELIENTIGKKIFIFTNENFTEAKLNNFQDPKIIESLVLYINTENLGNHVDEDDVALLVVGQQDHSKHFIKLSNTMPKQGDQVYSIGMPRSVPFILSTGIISSDYYLNGKYIANFANIFIANGSSGGPLFNSNLELIGLASLAVMSESELQSSLGIFVTVNKIKEYLDIVKGYETIDSKKNNWRNSKRRVC